MRKLLACAHQFGGASLLSAGCLIGFSTAAEAACLSSRCSQNGLIFSPASSHFTITDVTGNGTLEDPFVVYQNVLGLDISLAISNLNNATHHSIFNRPGFAIRIVSHNLTGAFWRFYDHELQESAGFASSENDGLSFAQGIDSARPYISSHYDKADEITDVRDFINFYQGRGVAPGETVEFNYVITDTIPTQQFYLRQRPDYSPAAAPAVLSQRPPNQPANVRAPKTPPPVRPELLPSASSLKAVTPQPATVIKSESIPAKPAIPQPIPEPSNIAMGALTLLFSRARKRCKQTLHQD